jgi:hypothetical protein
LNYGVDLADPGNMDVCEVVQGDTRKQRTRIKVDREDQGGSGRSGGHGGDHGVTLADERDKM